LARQGAHVRVGSREASRAESIVESIRAQAPDAQLEPVAADPSGDLSAALSGCSLVIAAGAASVLLLPRAARQACLTLRVMIDLNAVPPAGIDGVSIGDKGVERNGVLAYGAIGVGDLKMKIHKAAIARLFERNDQVLDAEEVYALGENL